MDKKIVITPTGLGATTEDNLTRILENAGWEVSHAITDEMEYLTEEYLTEDVELAALASDHYRYWSERNKAREFEMVMMDNISLIRDIPSFDIPGITSPEIDRNGKKTPSYVLARKGKDWKK